MLQALAVCLPLGGLFWQAFPFGMTPHYWGHPGPLVVAGSPAPAIVFLGVPLFGLFLYLTGLPAGSPAFHRRTRFLLFVPMSMAGWTALDFLRLHLELGHFWGGLYTTHGLTPILLWLASIGGPWLLSAVIAGGGALIALGLLALWPPAYAFEGRSRGKLGWGAILRQITPFIVGLLALTGAIRLELGLSQPLPAGEHNPATAVSSIRVAAIQPGRDMDDYQRLAGTADYMAVALTVLPDLERLTRQAMARGARLIVWPEAAFWIDPHVESQIRSRLVALAKEGRAYVLVTWFLDQPQNQPDRNESTILSPDGTFASDIYAKQHPIRVIGEGSATKGPLPVFRLHFDDMPGQPGQANRQLPVAVMMGYDLAFPDTARELTRRGAHMLVVGTHDWLQLSPIFGKLAALRASEDGVVLVKADWRLGSLIVAPGGRILAEAPADRYESQVLVADVPLTPTNTTAYVRTGDLVGWLALTSCAALLLWSWATRPTHSNRHFSTISRDIS